MKHNNGTCGIRSSFGGVQSTPRIMRGIAPRGGAIWDVPLEQRNLGDDEEVQMPAECIRAGEVMVAPGVCAPDVRRPVSPYSAEPATYAIPVSVTKKPAPYGGSAAGATKAGISPQLLMLGAICVATIYFLGRK